LRECRAPSRALTDQRPIVFFLLVQKADQKRHPGRN